MIVLDASLVVELLIEGPLAGDIRQKLHASSDSFIAPHLLDIEVISALRALNAARRVDPFRIRQALTELVDLPIDRFPHQPLLERIWDLRQNFTAYDAAYIALAEATGAVLYTTDTKLAKGHRADVVVFARAQQST